MKNLKMIAICVLITSCGPTKNQVSDSFKKDQNLSELDYGLKTEILGGHLIYVLDSPEFYLEKSNSFLDQISKLDEISVMNDSIFFQGIDSRRLIDYFKIQENNYIKSSEIARYDNETSDFIIRKGESEYNLKRTGVIQNQIDEIGDSLRCVIEVCPSNLTIGSSFFELFYVLKAIHPKEKLNFLENSYILSFAENRQTYDSLSSLTTILRNSTNPGKVVGCNFQGKKMRFKGVLKYEKGRYLSEYFFYKGYFMEYDDVSSAKY